MTHQCGKLTAGFRNAKQEVAIGLGLLHYALKREGVVYSGK